MNRRPDRQDQERFRKLSEVKTSAYFFAAEAETAFRERLGHLPAAVPPEPPVAAVAPEAAFAGMGSVFTLTGDLLAEREKSFDQAVLERVMAWIARRRAGRRRKSAFEAVRKVVCAIRQFIQSVTDGQAFVHLGVRGPTPRDPEKLAAWGVLFRDLLPTADLPSEARALVAALVAKLTPLVQELLEAIEEADGAKLDDRFAQAELERAREEVDAGLAKALEFLRSSLEFAGQDYLASRVLGKRRGRPRGSTKAKKEAALRKAAEAARESDAASHLAAEAGRKSDSAPRLDAEAGRKFDPAPAAEVPGALPELQEIEQAPNWVFTAAEEIVEGPSETWSAPEKIAEGPCKPCTEPFQDVEVASFQQDTTRLTGQTGSRLAGVLRRASMRLSPWAWIERFGTEDQNRRKAA